MKKSIIIDTRLKSKIEDFTDWSRGENDTSYSLKFKDIDDTFWFADDIALYDFLGRQISERFYDKDLRKGYFDYVNENGETLKYHIEVSRGTVTSVRDENVGVVSN